MVLDAFGDREDGYDLLVHEAIIEHSLFDAARDRALEGLVEFAISGKKSLETIAMVLDKPFELDEVEGKIALAHHVVGDEHIELNDTIVDVVHDVVKCGERSVGVAYLFKDGLF